MRNTGAISPIQNMDHINPGGSTLGSEAATLGAFPFFSARLKPFSASCSQRDVLRHGLRHPNRLAFRSPFPYQRRTFVKRAARTSYVGASNALSRRRRHKSLRLPLPRNPPARTMVCLPVQYRQQTNYALFLCRKE